MGETRLSILVALYSGNLSGVETYAEQVASTAAAANHQVTLLAVGIDVATELRRRIGGPLVRVVATDELGGSAWRSAARRVPTLALQEMQKVVSVRLGQLGERFDVAHLNHPALASAARPFADRVVVGAWFYPHRPGARLVETWRHTGAVFPKSAGLALKGLAHYWNDRQGYSDSDFVVAPTELLAAQLESLGIHAVACPPPGRRMDSVPGARRPESGPEDGRRRITICCGDLSHPRKNVAAGIAAVGLVGAGENIDLELIGRNADAFASLLNALPKSVRVLKPGALPRAEVEMRLASTDVLLVPSLYEEWGYVATEAVLSGTPVVALPVYPFVEILREPLGVCARDMSPAALADALRLVLDSHASRSLVASTAEAMFGVDAIGKRLSDIWSGRSDGPRARVTAASEPAERV